MLILLTTDRRRQAIVRKRNLDEVFTNFASNDVPAVSDTVKSFKILKKLVKLGEAILLLKDLTDFVRLGSCHILEN